MGISDGVYASEIANYLGSPLIGGDFRVYRVAPLGKASEGALVFSKNSFFELSTELQCLVLCPRESIVGRGALSYIQVDNPRLAFAKAVTKFFYEMPAPGIHPSATVGLNCVIPKSVTIGANCCLGRNVVIGENTVINNNVVIADGTRIGNGCYIKSCAVIGEEGFGFAFEDDKTPIRIPHLGNVVIGDNVEIGAHSTIARGTLGSTIISDFVKIDDQVFIAHNCVVGKKTVIIACAEISGSVTIGENCWLGPNSTIINNVVIGDNVTIGIGAIVTANVDPYKKIMGLESIELRSLSKVKKRLQYGA